MCILTPLFYPSPPSTGQLAASLRLSRAYTLVIFLSGDKTTVYCRQWFCHLKGSVYRPARLGVVDSSPKHCSALQKTYSKSLSSFRNYFKTSTPSCIEPRACAKSRDTYLYSFVDWLLVLYKKVSMFWSNFEMMRVILNKSSVTHKYM